jgi:hypothetical protein
VWGYGGGSIGGAGDGVALPGQEEDNAAVGGVGIDQALGMSIQVALELKDVLPTIRAGEK